MGGHASRVRSCVSWDNAALARRCVWTGDMGEAPLLAAKVVVLPEGARAKKAELAAICTEGLLFLKETRLFRARRSLVREKNASTLDHYSLCRVRQACFQRASARSGRPASSSR